MRTTSRSWWLLGAFGALSAAAGDAAFAGDPSQWTCESCPFPKAGVAAAVDVGVGAVSDASAKFGDFTGLDRQGGYLIVGGSANYRTEEGLYGKLSASDLGLDIRSLSAQFGREGLFRIGLGYSEIPHRLSDSATTPFLGVGGPLLTLPAGFPAATTGAMPQPASLQAVDIGFKRSRYELGGSWSPGGAWSYRLSLHHDVRDGTQRSAGAFFATSSQLIAPVDQVTDRFELAAIYGSRRLQATLAYQASLFRNGPEALTWSNPFTNGTVGSGSGQLALAPDNEFHQVLASVGYEITPAVRASGEVAVGRMTQDAGYLAPTLNSGLAVPALPATSLHGRASTLNASLRLSAAATERLRLSAVASHDERDNETSSLAYPVVSTDMFLGAAPRFSQPYSFRQDRLKLGGDYRGPGSVKLSFAAEHDERERTLQETDTTREDTIWGRVSAKLRDNISVALKLAHAERTPSGYQPVAFVDPAENPLLRKFNLADRKRDSAGLRGDIALGERVNLGLNVDVTKDDYDRSTIGLLDGRSVSVGADVAWAVSDETQLHVFAQGEEIRSRQAGSQLVAQPDWWGRTRDSFEVLGLGARHLALKGKLELGADLVFARSRSRMWVDTGLSDPGFPTATTARDTLKLHATYRLRDNLSLIGSYWYERYDAQDWRLDGVLPATVPNLLALGEQPPRYHVNVLGVAVRYRFK